MVALVVARDSWGERVARADDPQVSESGGPVRVSVAASLCLGLVGSLRTHQVEVRADVAFFRREGRMSPWVAEASLVPQHVTD